MSWSIAELTPPVIAVPHRPRRFGSVSARNGYGGRIGRNAHKSALASSARRQQEEQARRFQNTRTFLSLEEKRKRASRERLKNESTFSSTIKKRVDSVKLEKPATALRNGEDFPGAKQLYLLTNFLAFDKFTNDERSDILQEMVGKWLDSPYDEDEQLQSMWKQVEMYCESSFYLKRLTSDVLHPNLLSCAVCCELLEVVSKKDTIYRRILNVIKNGVFKSLYANYSDRKSFLDMEPWFEIAKRLSRMKVNVKQRDPSVKPGRQVLLSTADPINLASEIIDRRGSDFARQLVQEIEEALDRSDIL